jgi:hypothetical protein
MCASGIRRTWLPLSPFCTGQIATVTGNEAICSVHVSIERLAGLGDFAGGRTTGG